MPFFPTQWSVLQLGTEEKGRKEVVSTTFKVVPIISFQSRGSYF